MSHDMIAAFLSGLLVAADGVIALFFLKFWRNTHDRLFLIFSLAFAILGLQRTFLALGPASEGFTMILYAGRALAFILIIAAIVDKNARP